MISKKLINQMNEYYGCEYIVTEKPKKQKLKTIVEQINKENAPPDGWRKEDAVPKDPAQHASLQVIPGKRVW
jgi:hypothetical protein